MNIDADARHGRRVRRRSPLRRAVDNPYLRNAVLAAAIVVSGAWKMWLMPVSVLEVVGGCAIGLCSFAFAVWVLSRCNTSALVVEFKNLRRGLCRLPRRRCAGQVLRAAFEETAWRGALQTAILGGGPLALLATAGLFTARHAQIYQHRVATAQIAEFALFAFTLGALVAATDALLPAALAHAMRNVAIFAAREGGEREHGDQV
ncbi:CPBP family glutamic-type intramembrane protease [Roseivivax lentus]|uniref:CPBP family glutamic-type intramembrane protease n=1 Tax=Roseivivax lentus TaxID=633194 RepID=UPI00097035BE|nr:CPBP family glutamic-type intramembrane protease [Roseivivax lentus]